METKIGIIAVMAHGCNRSDEINRILHEFSHCIVGRMGLPRPDRQINVISVVVEATADTISSLAGRLGRIEGVKVKSIQEGK